ncbi:DUF3575 domain-containing protein [Roseimarinus sediminis]|uniref:DUF3575 domain-containing protein n=1 Tax=Roseimarinus sediminis TaxID=1610899 RepID=UPI003D23B3F6
MKRLLFLSLFVTSMVSFAQENVVKLGLSGITYGDYSLAYERALTPRSSMNLNLGYWDMNIGFFNTDQLFNESGGISFEGFNTGWHTALDFRFYVGASDAISGLYIGPYLRYWNYGVDFSDEIETNNFTIDARLSSIGAGFQMGYHWLIDQRWSIDLYFVGMGAESVNINANYRSSIDGFNYAQIEDDVKKAFDDSGYLFLYSETKTTVHDDHLNVRFPFWIPGIKTGFSIGYAF